VIYTLTWKEYREHRSIWLTMVALTGLLGWGVVQLNFSGTDPAGTLGVAMLALAATYGVVCGAMMFAGEKEGGTLVLLDIFLGRRDLLWFGKLCIGVVLAAAEALAVAAILHFLKYDPPGWMTRLAGIATEHAGPLAVFARPGTGVWFAVLPMVTMEALAWGLLGSSLTQRVLAGAGLGIVMGFFVWMMFAFLPQPASMFLRIIVVGAVLLTSFAIFSAQARDTPSQPPPVRMLDPKAEVLRQMAREIYLEPEVVRQTALDDLIVVEPVVEPAPWEAPPTLVPVPARNRRRRPIAQANSPSEALRWLTWQQGAIPLVLLGLACFVAGACMPFAGQVLWPIATLLIGLGCGTATFGWEQSDLSYQFLAAQHFPLKTIWNVKILFWLTAAMLASGLLLIAGAGLVLLMAAARPAGDPNGGVPLSFGSLLGTVGPVSFFGMSLAYGFSVAQLMVLLCRKTVYAVILSGMVSAAALGLWLPSLLCRGMSGWQIWVFPVAMLLATRVLMRDWAGGRIKERNPLAALIGVGLALLAWAGVNFGYRAWHIPDTAEPLDRLAFRAALPAADANVAGKKIQEALSEIESAEGKKEVWQARMAEVSLLPVGVIETPSGDGQSSLLRHLPTCRKLSDKLLEIPNVKPEFGLARVTEVLALSRNLRNQAPLGSYLAGVETEQDALAFVESWVAREKPSPELLRRIIAELDRHLNETPPPLDCLRTECYRAGGLLQNPIAWRMQAPDGTPPERWLTGVIALSLDTPWENERIARLWRQAWGGLFRGVETPHWQLAELPADDDGGILAGWLPADDGLSLSRGELARLLEASWLTDEKLFAPVLPLRQAATRSRWRVDSIRQAAALRLYQLREGKIAQELEDLVPKYLPELPTDPYSGKGYQYRISKGENVDFLGDGGNPVQHFVLPGHGILWSTGPDRTDDGGRKHGGEHADNDRQWSRGGYDLITIVPFWP
jgi:hypothetical protein